MPKTRRLPLELFHPATSKMNNKSSGVRNVRKGRETSLHPSGRLYVRKASTAANKQPDRELSAAAGYRRPEAAFLRPRYIAQRNANKSNRLDDDPCENPTHGPTLPR